MNSLSINGKNWISKEFNSDDINFFKTNYFLDEIVAKLLSIKTLCISSYADRADQHSKVMDTIAVNGSGCQLILPRR